MNSWYLVVCIVMLSLRAEGACPDGYCRHSGACYLVVGLNTSWIQARSYCPVLGGSLLSVTSVSQQTAVEGALRRNKGIAFPGNFWLDITDLLNPKDWKHMSSRTAISYSNWDTSYKQNTTEVENCAYISEQNNYYWQTASCNRMMNFICYTSGTKTRKYNMYRGYYYDYDSDSDDVEC